MEPQAAAQELPTEPKAIAAGLLSNRLQPDAQAAVQLLLQIQSGYESNKISEQEYFPSVGELVKKISPQDPSAAQPQAPQGASGRLQALYKQKAELARILDGLADAAASEKVPEALYEKLHVAANARLSAVQAKIDAEPAPGQQRVVAVQRKEVVPSAIIIPSSASKQAELPARAMEIKQELASAPVAPAQAFEQVGRDWAARYEKSVSDLEDSERRMKSEAAQFKSTLDGLYSKLSNLESQVANLQTETGYIGGDVSKIKVAEQQESRKQDTEARISALSNEFEGRIMELSTRLSNAESQMAQRLAEIRQLVDKVDQFRQTMDIAAESARQVQEIQRQVDRAERVAGLLGKTFVSSRKKFDELDLLCARQEETSAAVVDLRLRLSGLETRLGIAPIPQAQARTQPASQAAAAPKAGEKQEGGEKAQPAN
jgi:hypothetical protein